MLNIAIVGAGFMGGVHTSAYLKIDDTCVLAIVDNNIEKGEQLAKIANCKFYRDIEDLPNDKIDIIDICLPSYLHIEAIEKAVSKSKNIICEKPLCLNYEQFKSISGILSANDTNLFVAQVLRFWNGYSKIKELVDSGAIGNINSIICKRRQKCPSWAVNNWFMDAAKSGGIIFDLAIHDIDYVLWLMGKPKAVFARTSSVPDVNAVINLIYEDCTVTIFSSWGMPSMYNNGVIETGIELIGVKGMLCYENSNDDIPACKENNSSYIVKATDAEISHIDFQKYNGYETELWYFVNCIKNDIKPEIIDLNGVGMTIEVCSAAVKSAQKGEEVFLL